MPGRNSMCIGIQKGVSRLGPLVVSFPSQVINEKIHINVCVFSVFSLFFTRIVKIFFNFWKFKWKNWFFRYNLFYFFILFIRHNWTSRRNNDNYNTSKCARGYEQQHLFVQKHNTFYCKIRRASMSHTHEIGGRTQIDTNKPEFFRKLMSYEVHTTR